MKALNAVKNKSLIRNGGFINGRFLSPRTDQQLFAVTDPATGETIAQLPRMKTADAQEAIEAAAFAWDGTSTPGYSSASTTSSSAGWRWTAGNERSKVLSRMSQLMQLQSNDLALIVAAETGKPLAEARGEIAYARSFVEYYAEEAKRIQGEILPANSPIDITRRRLLSMPQPVGPAALVTPWNFPAAMITRKLAPALAAGCSAVIKPAEQTPLSALALCAIAEEAGVPAGVVNCLTVDRDEVESVGLLLCHSPLIRKLSFTGSTAVGKWLMRESAATVKKLSLELGGNAPFLVFNDADLQLALQSLMQAKFRNAGQACIAANRVFVQAAVYDEFTAMVAAAVRDTVYCSLQLPDSDNSNTATSSTNAATNTIATNAATNSIATAAATNATTNAAATAAATAVAMVPIGPLIDGRALRKVHQHVSDSVSLGAQLLIGGGEHQQLNAAGGSFYLPTVIKDMTKEMLPYREETFGPVLPIFKFKTEEEAVALANDTPFGLAAYACTGSLGRAWRLSSSLEAGMVGINEGAISNSCAPFGGVKESGLGREGGPYGLLEYMETKFVCMGGLHTS